MEASRVAGSGPVVRPRAGLLPIATLPSGARGCGLRPVPALPGAVTRLRAAPSTRRHVRADGGRPPPSLRLFQVVEECLPGPPRGAPRASPNPCPWPVA